MNIEIKESTRANGTWAPKWLLPSLPTAEKPDVGTSDGSHWLCQAIWKSGHVEEIAQGVWMVTSDEYRVFRRFYGTLRSEWSNLRKGDLILTEQGPEEGYYTVE